MVKLAGGAVHAPLVVGCDGARSIVRKAAGLRFEGHDYDATAISTTVKLTPAAQWRGAAGLLAERGRWPCCR
jgi:2-polyprenyl-6-methoxyphenol hydroxylase-like FAD-dependent oxidoreductase